MSKLTHADLIKLGRLLGYSISDGLCAGFSGMLMQAIVSGEEHKFWQRLKLIEYYKSDFSLLIKKINEVKLKAQKSNYKLTEQEMELLEIPAFYEGIELYLHPMRHSEIFNQYISQNDSIDIYSLAKSRKLENNNLTVILDHVYACDKKDLKNYINDLELNLHGHPDLPVFLESINHSVLLKWGTQNPEKTWMYMDTNDFHRYAENPNYYRELSTEELVDSLMWSMNRNFVDDIVFRTKIVADKIHVIHQQAFQVNIDKKYKITPEHAMIVDANDADILHFYSRLGQHEMVEYLLALVDININKAIDKGYTPLIFACQDDHTEVIKLLLAHKNIRIDKATSDGTTPLYIACQKGHAKAIKLLLAQENIAINKATLDGYTPLHIACQKGRNEVVSLLLDRKDIEINKTTPDDGYAPLHLACERGYTEIVKLLLDCENIAINKSTSDGWSPLHLACKEGHVEIIKLLLAHKDIATNKLTLKGVTPLHIACQNGFVTIVNILLQSPKVQIDSLGIQKYTPLLVACLSPDTEGKNELFRALLDKKANMFLTNASNQTALDIAVENNNETAMMELLIHAKKENLPLVQLMSCATRRQMSLWVSAKLNANITQGFFSCGPFLELQHFLEQKLQQINDSYPLINSLWTYALC